MTDLPLSALFTAALLFSLAAEGEQPNRVAAAVSLALAALAKGLVPLVLFLPVLVLDYRNLKRWFQAPVAVFAIIAAPWYALCAARNPDFLRVFFVEQQFNRFQSNALQHVQPWWFYLPVLCLLLYPWFPLLPLTFRHFRDARIRVLAVTTLWGLVFFSAALNKLPGYVLPLIPAICVLVGFALARAAKPERWFIAPIAALGILPLAISILPDAMAHGLAHGFRSAGLAAAAAAIAIALAAGVGLARWLRSGTVTAAAFLAAAGFFWAEIIAFPALNPVASARSLWEQTHPECAPVLPRGMLYSLYYYSEKVLPACGIVDKNTHTGSASGIPQ